MNKRKVNYTAPFFIILFAAILFIGCSDDNNPADSNNGNTAKIEGRVTGAPGFSKKNSLYKTNGIEGAIVTVSKVQANGSLSTVSNTSVVTDSEGKFTVETNSLNENNLVVTAVMGDMEWKAVVSGSVSGGSTTYCPPLNDETTAEAEVYLQVTANGKSNSVNYTDIQYYIDSEVAAEIKGNATLTSNLATAVSAEAEAKAKTFANAQFSISSSAQQSINSAKASAQAQLETSLYIAGENQSNYNTAFEAYQTVVLNAYVNAGVKKSDYAKIIEISTDEMLRVSSSISSEANLALRKSAAKVKAYVISKAQEEEIVSSGGQTPQKNAVITAGITLRASIDAAASANEIDAAFSAYHDIVIEQLKLSMDAHASVVASIDSSINSTGGFRAVLVTSLAAAVSTDAVVNAYITFYGNVKSIVETQLSMLTSAQVKAAADIIVISNM